MLTRTRLYPFLLLLFLLGTVSCGSNTELVGSWMDPQFASLKISKVLVLGIAKDPWRRAMFERDLQSEFTSHGIEAVMTMEVLPGDKELNKETFREYFNDHGFDAVVVSRVLEVKDDQHTVTEYNVPYGYGSFYGYYNMSWSYLNTRPATVKDQMFRIETNVFETTDGKLVWNGLSSTTNPEKLSEITKPLSRTIVKALQDRGLLGAR